VEAERLDLEYRIDITALRLREHWFEGCCEVCSALEEGPRLACQQALRESLRSLQDQAAVEFAR
jgi:hypothetical protein